MNDDLNDVVNDDDQEVIRDETEGGDNEPIDSHELDAQEAYIGDEIDV